MTFLASQLGKKNSYLRKFAFSTRLIYRLIALNIGKSNFQKDGDDMFIPKEMFFFIMKDWCVSFSCPLQAPVVNPLQAYIHRERYHSPPQHLPRNLVLRHETHPKSDSNR